MEESFSTLHRQKISSSWVRGDKGTKLRSSFIRQACLISVEVSFYFAIANDV